MVDFIDGIRARALLAVLRPDQEANLRHIFRWYSRTFHTPLHEVDDLPVEEILLHWFEAQFEDMEEPEWQMLLRALTTPPKVLEAEEDAAAALLMASSARRAKSKKKGPEDPLNKTWGVEKAIEAQMEALKKGLDGIVDDTRKAIKKKAENKPVAERRPEPDEATLNAPLEEITIIGGNLEDDLDKPSFGPPPRKRK